MGSVTTERTSIIGLRFQKLGKLYHFKVGSNGDIEPGDYAIVETKRGRQLGQVIGFIDPEQVHRQKGMRTVERKANPRDMVMKQVWVAQMVQVHLMIQQLLSIMGIGMMSIFLVQVDQLMTRRSN